MRAVFFLSCLSISLLFGCGTNRDNPNPRATTPPAKGAVSDPSDAAVIDSSGSDSGGY